MRSIINSTFPDIFGRKIHELLNERILIGYDLIFSKTMRPLACSVLADLIHGVDGTLEASQIRKSVHAYSKNLLEGSLDAALQSVSVNLLLSMVGYIANIANKANACHHIFLILNAIGNKFAAIKKTTFECCKAVEVVYIIS